MREIRFRAWDWKKMRFPVNIPNIQDLWESILCEFENHNWIYIETCPPNWWKFEVEARMQYTWLKDKNWKEIYEWDIVEVIDNDEVIIWRWTVEWFDKFTFWNISNIEDWLWDILYNNYVYIIWNIYENPELLNTNNKEDELSNTN